MSKEQLERLDLSYLKDLLLENTSTVRSNEILEEYAKKHMVLSEELVEVLENKYKCFFSIKDKIFKSKDYSWQENSIAAFKDFEFLKVNDKLEISGVGCKEDIYYFFSHFDEEGYLCCFRHGLKSDKVKLYDFIKDHIYPDNFKIV